jgi:hypothetical protein
MLWIQTMLPMAPPTACRLTMSCLEMPNWVAVAYWNSVMSG